MPLGSSCRAPAAAVSRQSQAAEKGICVKCLTSPRCSRCEFRRRLPADYFSIAAAACFRRFAFSRYDAIIAAAFRRCCFDCCRHVNTILRRVRCCLLMPLLTPSPIAAIIADTLFSPCHCRFSLPPFCCLLMMLLDCCFFSLIIATIFASAADADFR